MPQKPLTTERLDLVPLADEHVELEVALDADPVVMHFVSGRSHSRAEVERSHDRRMARGRQLDGLGFWVGFLRTEPDRPFVGWWILGPTTGPDQPDWRTPGLAELGYRLHTPFWRQGLATEGSAALLSHGFDDLGLRRVIAQAARDNVGSQGVMRSLGMTRTRSWVGEDGPEVEYEMTRHSWFSRHLT